MGEYVWTPGEKAKLILLGLNKTFKPFGVAMTKGGAEYRVEPFVQAHDWLMANWTKWCPAPWHRRIRIHNGGGPWWPNKVLEPKKWNDDKRGVYSIQHKKRARNYTQENMGEPKQRMFTKKERN